MRGSKTAGRRALSVVEKRISGVTAFTLTEALIASIRGVKQTFCFRDNSAGHRQERVRENKMFAFAFTLAEVLIVLGIIGLIADMTIPTLISSTREKVAVTRLQKTYSILESAYRFAVAEDGTPENWGLKAINEDGAIVEGGANMLQHFEPYLKILKRCDGNNNCSVSNYKLLGGGAYNNQLFQQGATAMLADGSVLTFTSWSDNCSNIVALINGICGSIVVDINGMSKPNQFGVDHFIFYLTKTSVIPWGTEKDNGAGNDFKRKCIHGGNNFENGYSCTAWVLYNENMDYLHCSDLSWSGKKSCNDHP